MLVGLRGPAGAARRAPATAGGPPGAAARDRLAAGRDGGRKEWRDRPLTPGDWSYDAADRQWRFMATSACAATARSGRSFVSRAGASGTLRLRTTFGASGLFRAGAALPADDPLLDELAFSRGRFTVEATGLATLVLPAWPEPARVIEDCRG